MTTSGTASGMANGKVALWSLSLGLFGVLAVSLYDRSATQWLFVHTTYYLLLGTLLCWVGLHVHAARALSRATVVAWLLDNWRGLLVAAVVTTIAALSVEPALRVLSDEANLVGTSKNLFASKTATFTVSGKNYYGSYWDVDVAIDRRPTLFPFLVSLLHSILGYTHENAFHLNLVLLAAFLLVSYRLAKSLAGETFGIAASLLVVAHPITLVSARSGGFDLLAALFGVLVLKSLLDVCREQSPNRLALLWLNLCLFAEVRYESALFLVPVVALLLLFRMVPRSALGEHAFIYALTPAFLLPRIWQGLLRGNVPEQEPGTVTFSVANFLSNAHEYLLPVLSPLRTFPAHSVVVLVLGIAGVVLTVNPVLTRVRARAWPDPELRFAGFVVAWMALQVVIVFAYVWGKAQYPSAARLVIPIDTFLSFCAAWALTLATRRWSAHVAVLASVGVLTSQLSVASQGRLLNKLTQTRESATTWSFFERLNDPRILIVTDRPNHFTIMNYGAMSFDAARRDPYLFTAFERRLFQDVYVIQPIRLSTGEPLPGYEIWPERDFEVVFEFQNDADVLVRISRLRR